MADDVRASRDEFMSDQWVGPGWWMASDGRWYPPRTSKGLDDVASRAERAANMPRPSPFSVRRPDPGDEIEPANPANEDSMGEDVAAHDASEQASSDDVAEDVTEVEDVAEVVIDLRDSNSDSIDLDAHELVASSASARNIDESPGVGAKLRPNTGTTSARSLDYGEANGSASVDSAPSVNGSASFSAGGSANDSIWTADDADKGHMRAAEGHDPRETPDARESPSVPLQSPSVPLQHAVLPEVAQRGPARGARTLLIVATALAILSGILGALWLRERSTAQDLRVEIDQVASSESLTGSELTNLTDEVRTLRLQNEQLRAQLNDMSALVLELPEGRVTEIAVPFTPVFADEENGRFIAVGADGAYVIWADGADEEITDSGVLSGGPTGVFAATAKAWIATDASTIEIVSLNNTDGLPTVQFGPVDFMAAEERAYWTYERSSGNVVRLRKSDGGVTASVAVPVPVVDLAIGAGSVWALGDDGRVYRINTADFTVQAIDAGTDLISITAGPDALWTLSAADGSLRRVDPVSGEVLVTVPVGRDPIDATFAGSSVWVALRSGTSLIEVDTRTAAVISRTALPGTPTALHEGDTGVFVTLEGEVPLVRVASLTQTTDEVDEGSADAEAAVGDANDAG